MRFHPVAGEAAWCSRARGAVACSFHYLANSHIRVLNTPAWSNNLLKKWWTPLSASSMIAIQFAKQNTTVVQPKKCLLTALDAAKKSDWSLVNPIAGWPCHTTAGSLEQAANNATERDTRPIPDFLHPRHFKTTHVQGPSDSLLMRKRSPTSVGTRNVNKARQPYKHITWVQITGFVTYWDSCSCFHWHQNVKFWVVININS